ncbi:hypothetical protein HNR22_004917 [Micromonospora jinlongensis]|uniref:DUF1963 domain-containing protein n=1 Tax=Micromonospora jinlongensis TaxID=1287877 RepID=A0A7Z0BGQ8_9ACTN|nr:DUF1963 domain-containing protein [Micromonospora jinlongensis]NYH45190.1 hypothetical protein [Micromonospora jinlongensis]
MTSRNVKILDQVRAEALRRDIPAADVERWLELARPSALLTVMGDGPVVGVVHGPPKLPADAEDPKYPLIASIDCAALPAGVTDLPLPPDGQLLLFGWPEDNGYGEVRYVPAGVAVEEREQYPSSFPPEDEEYSEVYAEMPQHDLRLTVDVSLPYVETIPGPPWSPPLPGDPPFEEMTKVWRTVLRGVPDGMFAYGGYAARLLLGGYGTEYNGFNPAWVGANPSGYSCYDGPVRGGGPPDHGDWVLLAEFHGLRSGGATIHWVIQRADLKERRFDQARVLVYWNP